MAISASEFQELVRELEQRPEWRRELRRVLLSDDVIDLPRLMGELAQAQRATEARLERLTERVDQLTQRVDQLAAAQQEMTSQLAQLTRTVEHLVKQMQLLTNQVGRLKGSDWERRYRERAPAYFAPLLRRIHALSSEEIAALLDDAEERGLIAEKVVTGLTADSRVLYSYDDGTDSASDCG
ncbi:MAG: hypothetical protein HY699_02955 [Deltaproteobacteria bacterium]|nr:hypothetical protein [Deltaproteobacteria bacterium]